jgi:hypothetical protein
LGERSNASSRPPGLLEFASAGGPPRRADDSTGTTTAPRYGVDLRAVAKQQLPEELKKVLPTSHQQGLEQLLPGKR